LPNDAVNPVKSAAKIQPLAKRDRLLADAELKALWLVTEGEAEPWRTSLQLLILTGQRREEVLQADWSEFDLKGTLWTIPAARVKNKQTHLVPLAPEVVRILKKTPEQDRIGRLFNSGTGPASRAAKRIRDAMPEGTPAWRWHDIRRTVATGMQRLGIRLEVTEAVLNHVSGSRGGIVGVYQRHDWAEEKRTALGAWAKEVDRIAAGRTPDAFNVVALKT